MKYILFSFITSLFSAISCFADNMGVPIPPGTILDSEVSLVELLGIVQSLLLTAVLPLVVIGTALYIAYQLLTADGDESRMKQAWKSLGYGVIALVMIALSYLFVDLLSTIEL